MVDVSTTKYQWAHGKAPRGAGVWAYDMPDGTVWRSPYSGSVTEANRAAVAEARRRGLSGTVQVAP